MDTTDLLRARQSGPWSRVKLLDDGKMSYSMEGPPSLDIGRMTLEYCLTSPVIDREGDLILPDAPDWTDHERNPLTLFNHKLDQPFGKSQDTTGRYTVERRGDRWYGKSYLFQNDPFAEEVYRLAEKGALNGASIGFLPAKPPFGQSSVKKMNGYDYTVIERCKVFEWSAVYIPMNQDALLVAAEVVRKGLGNKPLSSRAMAMFSPYVAEAPVWANGWRAKGPGWEESAHPRGDDGQFISGGDISAAAGDKDKEAELRKRVTDPKQIQRLNVALTTEPNKSSGDFGDKYNKLEGDKLGQGSTGDVYRVGNTAVKKASKAESQVYKEMSNVDGIAHGVTHGDQIVTPYFKNIISIDAIKDKDRKGMAPIIAKAYPTLVNALTHLSEVGYDYNDDLQVGFDEKRNPNIFDFSITAKTGPVEATRENLDRLSSYLKTFGCEKLANNVSTVSIIRSAMGDLDNTLMEDDEEYKFAAKLASQLDGKEAKYFYYSSNGRTIPNAAQTEQVKGIKVIASDKPLSSKFMTDWEITPVIHKYGNGEKSFRRGTTKAAGWSESDHPRAEDGKFGSGGKADKSDAIYEHADKPDKHLEVSGPLDDENGKFNGENIRTYEKIQKAKEIKEKAQNLIDSSPLHGELETIDESIADLKEELAGIKDDLADAKAEVEQWHTDREDGNEVDPEDLESFEKRRDALALSRATLEGKLSEANANYDKKEAEISALSKGAHMAGKFIVSSMDDRETLNDSSSKEVKALGKAFDKLAKVPSPENLAAVRAAAVAAWGAVKGKEDEGIVEAVKRMATGSRAKGFVGKAAGWNESDHPRAEDGKFGSGGGSNGATDKKQSSILTDEKKMSSLSGAPGGASVEVSPDEDGKGSMIYFSDSDKKQRLYSGAIYVRDDGDGLKMKIESLDIRPDAQGQGIGKKIVEDIIANAKANGIEEISVGARRADGMNGYYSWARYGFDCPIPFDKVLPLPKSLDGSKTVQDLMKTKEGRDWWKENGTSVRMYLNPQKGEKSLAPSALSNKPAHRLNGKQKMYDEKPDETMPPVDPIEAKADDSSPATPLGAQLIAGAHEIAMGLAKFYTDNVAQLEPELIQEFSKLEKTIMGSIAAMAQMFNGRYGDLPPLDGADWIDPDMDGDIDLTEDPVLNPDAEEDKAMAEGIQEDVVDGEDVTVDADDATEDEVDATEDDEVEEEEEEVKPRFKKSFEEAAKRSLKALLEGWQAKQKALKDAAKRIEHPDAVVAVKAAAQFLRTMAGDPREDKVLRGRAKKLRSDLLNALPKVKAKAVVEIAPVTLDIDLDKIADHFNSARKAMEVDAQAIEEKINKLFQLTGR